MSENIVSNIAPIRAGMVKPVGVSSEGKYLMRGGSDHQMYEVEPIRTPSSEEIAEIRNATGLDEKTFAKALGVSENVYTAWEAGEKKPQGSACRLLEMVRIDQSVIDRFV